MPVRQPLDPVRAILADLATSVGRVPSTVSNDDLIEKAIERLRVLYPENKQLFTASILKEIEVYKERLAGAGGPAIVKESAYLRSDEPSENLSRMGGVTALPVFITVGKALQGVGDAIRETFPSSLWIRGEVSAYNRSTAGYHYFNLVEAKADRSQLVLPCIIWKTAWEPIQAKLKEAGIGFDVGQDMLFFGSLRLYEESGKLNLYVTDVFPEFTIGQIEMQRRRVIARLQKEGLTQMNKRHRFPDLPLRIGLVSSRTAAGKTDFKNALQKSGYAFDVLDCDVPVQGLNVESAVCLALESLAANNDELKLDVVCIVRGGGNATDLGWWNSYAICACIAKMPMPVITGIGHERDKVAADEVAHTCTATPTAAAELLCRTVRLAETTLASVTDAILQIAKTKMVMATEALFSATTWLTERTEFILAAEQQQTSSLRDQLIAHARRALDPHHRRLGVFVNAIASEPQRTVENQARVIGGLAREVAFSSNANLRQKSLGTGAIAHQIIAYARRSLDQHAARLHVSVSVVSGESLRAVQAMMRAASSLERELALLSVENLKKASEEAKEVIRNLSPLLLMHLRATDKSLVEATNEFVETASAVHRGEETRLLHLQELIDAHDPRSVLRRGFSITLDEHGRAIKNALSVSAGKTIVTKLAEGELESTITKAS